MRFFTFQRSHEHIHHLLHQFYKIWHLLSNPPRGLLEEEQASTRRASRRKLRLQKITDFHPSPQSQIAPLISLPPWGSFLLMHWMHQSAWHFVPMTSVAWCRYDPIEADWLWYSPPKSTNHKLDRLDECINVSFNEITIPGITGHYDLSWWSRVCEPISIPGYICLLANAANAKCPELVSQFAEVHGLRHSV